MSFDHEAVVMCRAAGFDPDIPEVWSWWCGLPHETRKELAEAMDQGKMPTFTDLGIHANQVNARPRR